MNHSDAFQELESESDLSFWENVLGDSIERFLNISDESAADSDNNSFYLLIGHDDDDDDRDPEVIPLDDEARGFSGAVTRSDKPYTIIDTIDLSTSPPKKLQAEKSLSAGRMIDRPKEKIPETLWPSCCSVCLEEFSEDVHIGTTFCGHIFCVSCIKQVLRSHKRCPTCRKTLCRGFIRLYP